MYFIGEKISSIVLFVLNWMCSDDNNIYRVIERGRVLSLRRGGSLSNLELLIVDMRFSLKNTAGTSLLDQVYCEEMSLIIKVSSEIGYMCCESFFYGYLC